jgi:hypothetical protein
MRAWLGLIGWLVLLLCASITSAQSAPTNNEQLCADAEAAFKRGVEQKEVLLVARKHFVEATDLYLELHRRGVRTPALYLNLGNAATLADRWPEAIWAYHMGLKLDPNDAALPRHLAFVRGKVIYPPAGQGRPEADTWPTWLHRPSIAAYYCTAAAAYLVACLAAAGVFLWRSPRLVLVLIVFTLVALGAIISIESLWREAQIDRDTPLVVVAHNTQLHRGNAASYPQHAVLPTLPRGMEVRQQHRRGDWLQVRLTTGEVGWIHASAALIVEP